MTKKKKKKEPTFPFYYSDWLGSSKRAMMSPTLRAAYVDLLCHQWADDTCSLPDDPEVLGNLSGLLDVWLTSGCTILRDCFPKHPRLKARVANPRLLAIRQERDAFIKKSRTGGQNSAKARAAKPKPTKTSGNNKDAKQTPSKRQAKGQAKGQPHPQAKGNLPSPSPSPSPINGRSDLVKLSSSEKEHLRNVAHLARERFVAPPFKPWGDLSRDQQRTLLKIAHLELTRIPPAAVASAIEGVKLRQEGPPTDPVRYLLTTLTDVLTTRYGVEFRPMLNVVRVPGELLELAMEAAQ